MRKEFIRSISNIALCDLVSSLLGSPNRKVQLFDCLLTRRETALGESATNHQILFKRTRPNVPSSQPRE